MGVPFQLGSPTSQVHNANHGTLVYLPNLKPVCFQSCRCQYVLFVGMPIDAGDTYSTPEFFSCLLAMYKGSDLTFYSSCDGLGNLIMRNHAFSLLLFQILCLDLLAERDDGIEACHTLSIVNIDLSVSDVCKFARHLTVGQRLTAHIWTATKEHFLYKIIRELSEIFKKWLPSSIGQTFWNISMRFFILPRLASLYLRWSSCFFQ